MKNQREVQKAGRGTTYNCLHGVQLAIIGMLLVGVLPVSAQEKTDSDEMGPWKSNESGGIVASKVAGSKDVGLPLCPGSRPHLDKPESSPAFQLGLWGGSWSFKIVALKLESNDAPDKIATFYQKALAKYGRVSNCADSAGAASEQEKASSPNELTCHDTKPETGETVLKAGTKEKQHIVDIKTGAGLSIIQLVSLELPPSDSKK